MDDVLMMNYKNEPRRDIMCIDVKSFFASVESAERGLNPLSSNIVVVSKPENKGGLVLAAAPSVKEKYGIQTGTRIYEIPKNADIAIVEPRMALYVEKNLAIHRIFKRYVAEEDILVYSIDESFIDTTDYQHLYGDSFQIARKIQKDVWNELGLVITIGVGDNPLLAKLALDHEAKFDRSHHFIVEWRYEDVPRKVWAIEPLNKFWGIGGRTERSLNALGIKSMYDLSQYDFNILKAEFGVIGEQLFFHAHGVDRSIISDKYAPKSSSFSKNQILNEDYCKKSEVEVVIREMTDENVARLRKHHFTTGEISLSIGYSKHSPEKGFSRHLKIEATDASKKLKQYMLFLFNGYYDGFPVRSINVSFGDLKVKQGIQLNLFETADENINEEQLDRTIDTLRQKFGYTSILHASSLSNGAMAKYRATLLGGHRAGKDKGK